MIPASGFLVGEEEGSCMMSLSLSLPLSISWGRGGGGTLESMWQGKLRKEKRSANDTERKVTCGHGGRVEEREVGMTRRMLF